MGEAENPWLSVVTTTDPIAKKLPLLLEKLSELAGDLELLVEVIVVDDLKQWPSSEAIDPPVLSGLQVRVLWYPEHRGHMRAVGAGKSAARAKMIATIDPDMYACAAELSEMATLLNKGYQAVHGQRLSRPEAGRFRRWGSSLTNYIVQAITGIVVPDICSPITLIRKEAVDQLTPVMQGYCSRLDLYSALGSSVAVYPLRNESALGSPSQYSAYGLSKAFLLLVIDALCVRSKRKKNHQTQ